MGNDQDDDADIHAIFGSLREAVHGTIEGFRAKVLARVEEDTDWTERVRPSWTAILIDLFWESIGIASRTTRSRDEDEP